MNVAALDCGYLRHAVRHFIADERLAFVRAAVHGTGRRHSPLTLPAFGAAVAG
jgi:hypothetical protein